MYTGRKVEVKAESAPKQGPSKHSPVKSPPKHSAVKVEDSLVKAKSPPKRSPEKVEVIDLTAEEDYELHPLTQLNERGEKTISVLLYSLRLRRSNIGRLPLPHPSHPQRHPFRLIWSPSLLLFQ